MKAKNIFKVVTLALAMPAMLLPVSCSNNDEITAEQAPESFLGYAIPVSIKADRSADDVTRAYYNITMQQIEFTEGDQLFVSGRGGSAGQFSLLADFQEGNTFYGTLYTQNPYEGTFEELFKASRVTATLLPKGYENVNFMKITGEGFSRQLSADNTRAFVPDKTLAIEQLLHETATYYDNGKGFSLSATKGIVGVMLTGLEPSRTYHFIFREHTISGLNNVDFDIDGYSTSDKDGVATFSIGIASMRTDDSYTIIIDDGAEYADVELGKEYIKPKEIVTVSRSVSVKETIDLSTLSAGTYTADHGTILTGELPAGVMLQIDDNATVTLKNANILSNMNSGITCLGNAVILLEGYNTVASYGPGIQAGPAETTLVIKGEGQLTVQGDDDCAAIGTANGGTCGNITISGGLITATAGNNAAATGTGNGGTCGTILLENGTIEATGKGYGAAVGTGKDGTCGNISVKDAIGKFTKGAGAVHSIGQGSEGSTIGKVTVGGEIGAISTSPYEYPETKFHDIWFAEPQYFNMAAGSSYSQNSFTGVTITSNGASSGSVVAGHMVGKFVFRAPMNRKLTSIKIKGKCNSVTSAEGGWSVTETGAEWAGTPATYVNVDIDIEEVTQLSFLF